MMLNSKPDKVKLATKDHRTALKLPQLILVNFQSENLIH